MIDIILISEAKTPELKAMTQLAIDSAHQSTQAPTQVLVMERTEHVYRDAITLHDNLPFNYNRMVNKAIQHCPSSDIIVANNDVEFLAGSPSILAQSRPLVVSPVDPWGPVAYSIGIEFGTQVARHFMGWCFLIRRHVWAHLGGFNEAFPFWYADNVIVDQLKTIGVMPAVNSHAQVIHRVSSTLKTLDQKTQRSLTHAETPRYQQLFSNQDAADALRTLEWPMLNQVIDSLEASA